MDAELRYGNGTYVRGSDGVWRYADGGVVPGAVDLTAADLLAIGRWRPGTSADRRPCTSEDLAWITQQTDHVEQILILPHAGRVPTCRDLVIGMSAPELQVSAMLTVGDLADLAGVSKATIDSYRYRGYLPEPQAVRGRTPLWSRPIVQRWLDSRTGNGANACPGPTKRSAATVPSRAG